jgi:hypothetical protein
MRGQFRFECRSNVTRWVRVAIYEESLHPPRQLWKGEPCAETAKNERFRRIRFLRKRAHRSPDAVRLADRLDACCRGKPCFSGACPECGRLFQRAWVRKSSKAISALHSECTELVAMSLVLPNASVSPGELCTFDVGNMLRRLRSRLDTAEIPIAIGGVDFSFNEDENEKYSSVWCPHVYVITVATNRRRLRDKLKEFNATEDIPRPKWVSQFENIARRRSYSMKMKFCRRIGYDDLRIQRNGKERYFRNARSDRLRTAELFELVLFLDQIGFSGRTIFRGLKPLSRWSAPLKVVLPEVWL